VRYSQVVARAAATSIVHVAIASAGLTSIRRRSCFAFQDALRSPTQLHLTDDVDGLAMRNQSLGLWVDTGALHERVVYST
jgi:hypothetical protein